MKGMSAIVQTVSRLVAGMLFLFGCYIILHGHLTPGGGFAGGVIVAGGLVLVVLAFGEQFSREVISHGAVRISDAVGALAFLSVALFGYLAPNANAFFANFPDFLGTPGNLLSAGTIPVSNLAIGVKVGAGLFGVFLVLALFRRHGERRLMVPDAGRLDSEATR
jgi:multisubunit Na+/H+ antiporter MnhB subunit